MFPHKHVETEENGKLHSIKFCGSVCWYEHPLFVAILSSANEKHIVCVSLQTATEQHIDLSDPCVCWIGKKTKV